MSTRTSSPKKEEYEVDEEYLTPKKSTSGGYVCAGCQDRINGNCVYDQDNESWHSECYQIKRDYENKELTSDDPFEEIDVIVNYWRTIYFRKVDELMYSEEKRREMSQKYENLLSTIQNMNSGEHGTGEQGSARGQMAALVKILEREKEELLDQVEQMEKRVIILIERSEGMEKELGLHDEVKSMLEEELERQKVINADLSKLYSAKEGYHNKQLEIMKEEIKELTSKFSPAMARRPSEIPSANDELVQIMQEKINRLHKLHEVEKKKEAHYMEIQKRNTELERRVLELEEEKNGVGSYFDKQSLKSASSVDNISIQELKEKYMKLKVENEENMMNMKGKALHRVLSRGRPLVKMDPTAKLIKEDSLSTFNLASPSQPKLEPISPRRSKKLNEMQASIIKEGPVQQRMVVSFDGKKTKREWKYAWAVLNNHFELYPSQESKFAEVCLEKVRLDLSDAEIEYEKDTKKKKTSTLIRIETETTGVFQIEVPNEDAEEWYSLLNQAASVTTTTLEDLAAARKSHCIPHRFKETFFTLNPTKCKYCGTLISKRGYKCIHCEFPCHEKCSTKVPPSCGLSDITRGTLKREKAREPSIMRLSQSSLNLNQFRKPSVLEPTISIANDVFGLNLAEVPGGDDDIPHVVRLCINAIERKGLQSEGLYRVSGIKGEIEKLRLHFSYGRPNLDDEVWSDINVISSALKLWFRLLPGSLLTEELYQDFVNAAKAKPSDKFNMMRRVLVKLPRRNYSVLKFTITHLKKVSDLGAVNKMQAANLAAIFGPTLMKSPKEDDFGSINDQVSVIEFLIDNCSSVFSERLIY